MKSSAADSVSSQLQLASIAAARRSSLPGSAGRRSSFDRFIPARRGSGHEAAYLLHSSTAAAAQNDDAVFRADSPPARPATPGGSKKLSSQDKVLAFSPGAMRTRSTGE